MNIFDDSCMFLYHTRDCPKIWSSFLKIIQQIKVFIIYKRGIWWTVQDQEWKLDSLYKKHDQCMPIPLYLGSFAGGCTSRLLQEVPVLFTFLGVGDNLNEKNQVIHALPINNSSTHLDVT